MAQAPPAPGSAPAPTPAKNLHERAAAAGIDLTKRAVETDDDNGDPARLFKIIYMPYLEPVDIDSIDETKRIDVENEKRYAFNQTQFAEIKILLRRLGLRSVDRVPKPGLYHERAHNIWLQRIYDPAYKTLKAVEYLHARGLHPFTDYKLEEASELADETSMIEFANVQKQKTSQRIDIRSMAPKDHHLVCNCNYTWDGVSQTCAGTRSPVEARLQVRWKMGSDDDVKRPYHFLNPVFVPVVAPSGYAQAS